MATTPAPPPSTGIPLERDEDVLNDKTESSPTAQKVTLDLDDAPFLEDFEEEVPDEEPQQREAETTTQEEGKSSGKPSRKVLIIAGTGCILLLAALLFWFTRSPPDPAPPEPASTQDIQQPQAPESAPEPKPEEFTLDLAPFWVAYTRDEEIVFLSLRLILVLDAPTLYLEAQRKMVVLRDAIYYFLNNRPLPVIKHTEAVDTLKTDLKSVINQHLSRPVTGILIEEYMVR